MTVRRVTSQVTKCPRSLGTRTTDDAPLPYFSEMTDVPCLAAHPIPEARPHPPSEAVKMDVFTDFRRGKTIETQKLDPYTPAGSHLGQYAAGAAG